MCVCAVLVVVISHCASVTSPNIKSLDSESHVGCAGQKHHINLLLPFLTGGKSVFCSPPERESTRSLCLGCSCECKCLEYQESFGELANMCDLRNPKIGTFRVCIAAQHITDEITANSTVVFENFWLTWTTSPFLPRTVWYQSTHMCSVHWSNQTSSISSSLSLPVLHTGCTTLPWPCCAVKHYNPLLLSVFWCL